MYSQNLPALRRSNWLQRLILLGLLATGLWLLNGCGGGATDPGAAATGEALVTLTDAEGDFATYTVDVTSITLQKADGSIVETLPNTTRLDFTQYIDMTELITAAQIPNGRYVSGAITLDYTNADIQVEVNGMAVPAQVVDSSGNPLTVYSLDIRLENDRPLVVRPGLPALLNIDFDLSASHDVDTSTPVPTVTAAPFLAADIEPVDEKELRVRGPLVETNIAESYYRVRLRPWYRHDGDFGRARVNITADTEFEVNGESYVGTDGLRALEALGPGTPTVALGTLVPAVHEYTADRVLAGDSVPGYGFDAVRGNITARNGNVLTVRGATVIPRSGSVVFNDDITVTVGDDTLVRKPGDPGVNQGIGALSVGQRVLILGTITSDPAMPGLEMDATQGRVRMRYTRLSGTANSVLPGQMNMTVLAIDHRRVQLFDFSGTGMTPDLDADPNDYEVDTGTLDLGLMTPQTPVRVIGFVRPFGEAPPDFEGRTVVDVAVARALLGVGWGNQGTTAPFIQIDPAGLVIDLDNPDLGERHHIRIGDVVIDLTQLPASPVIVGNSSGRRRFAIMQGHRVQMFRDFDRFVETLTGLLDGSTALRSLYAQGAYDTATNTVHARTIAVHLLSPALQP
ncbi:MAG TPA: metallophosphoesterase [Chromatiales bacterium]|nr:metallophosphoesterase [Chromatiales bacterium]